MLKKLTHSAAFLIILAASSTATAQNLSSQSNQLRLDLSLNSSATTFVDGVDELTVSESRIDTAIMFQSYKGLYGELGFASSDITDMTVNGRNYELSEDYTGNMFGFGYRLPLRQPGKYWGFGYQNSWLSGEESDSTNTLRTFWEKDNEKRYGVINLSYASDVSSGLLAVSGKHLWFVNQTVGIGVNWGVGSGTMDNNEVALGVANFGAVLMFRPKLNF